MICLILGRGIFVNEARPKNSFIVEYAGELITADEAYESEQEFDDNSIYRYFFRYKKQLMWYIIYPLVTLLVKYI